jgi:hypothetical protein
METVNEESVAVVTAIFMDEDDNLVTPSAASYQVDDLATGTSLIAETAFTPTSGTYDVIIPAAQNAIIDTTRSYETKVVTVSFTYGTGSAYAEYRYRVKNLNKVT